MRRAVRDVVVRQQQRWDIVHFFADYVYDLRTQQKRVPSCTVENINNYLCVLRVLRGCIINGGFFNATAEDAEDTGVNRKLSIAMFTSIARSLFN